MGILADTIRQGLFDKDTRESIAEGVEISENLQIVYNAQTMQLADMLIDIENFSIIAPEVDDTGRVQRALNTGRNVLFAQGKTYICKKITPIGNQTLIGYNSTLKFKDGETGALIDITNVSDVNIIGLTLDGGVTADYTLSSIKGGRIGIGINGSSSEYTRSINIDMCKIKGFDSEGIYITSMGYINIHGMTVNVSNTSVSYCYDGIFIGLRGEYCHFVNVACNKNRVGFSTGASNIFASNLHCNDNVDGIQLLLEVDGNDSHSGFVNCDFNHNTNYGIYAENFTVGVSMVGCHVQASNKIYLNKCSGFRFYGGQIRVTNIDIDGGGHNSFRDNLFDTVTITHAKNGNADQAEFINNTPPLDVTTGLNGYENISNYLIDRTMITAINGLTTETTVNFNNKILQLLYGQPDISSIYDLTGIGTIKQRGIYSFDANLCVANTTASQITVEVRFFVNTERIRRVSFNIPANTPYYFTNLSLITLLNKNDTWKVAIVALSGSVNLVSASEAHLHVEKIG